MFSLEFMISKSDLKIKNQFLLEKAILLLKTHGLLIKSDIPFQKKKQNKKTQITYILRQDNCKKKQMNIRGIILKNASSSYTLQELDFYIQSQKQKSEDMERICTPGYKTVNKLRSYQQADYKAKQ